MPTYFYSPTYATPIKVLTSKFTYLEKIWESRFEAHDIVTWISGINIMDLEPKQFKNNFKLGILFYGSLNLWMLI